MASCRRLAPGEKSGLTTRCTVKKLHIEQALEGFNFTGNTQAKPPAAPWLVSTFVD